MPTTTGRQASTGQTLTLVPDTPDPVNPAGAPTGRLTSDRFETALLTVVDSVVFRSSGRDLTTAGTYTWVGRGCRTGAAPSSGAASSMTFTAWRPSFHG